MPANLGLAILLPLLAGMSTVVGGAIGLLVKRPGPRTMALSLGFAGGVMLWVSLSELMPESVEIVGFVVAHVAFFVGMAFMYALDVLIPHSYLAEQATRRAGPRGGHRRHGQRHGQIAECAPSSREGMMRTALLVALGLGIHNFPEGVATFASTLHDPRLGGVITLAIAIHNIPEGLAVSIPICAASGDRKRAIWWSFLSGFAEVVGAMIAALFLLPFLNATLISLVLAGVAGVMVFISLDELIPMACSLGEQHLSIIGVGIGMATMALSIWLLR